MWLGDSVVGCGKVCGKVGKEWEFAMGGVVESWYLYKMRGIRGGLWTEGLGQEVWRFEV